MLGQLRLPVATANAQQSVWRNLDQDDFRRRIVNLQRASNEVPADPLVYSAADWQAAHLIHNNQTYALPFDVEQSIADDLAFVAAAEEGPKEISAVTLEEHEDLGGLTVRLSANEGVTQGVKETLTVMLDILHRCASRKLPRESCSEALFELVISINENRIHGRLESIHWKIPKSRRGAIRQPLHEAIGKLCLELDQLQSHDSEISCGPLVDRLSELRKTLRSLDASHQDAESIRTSLKAAVKRTHDLCTFGGVSMLEEAMSNHGLRLAQAPSKKTIRKLDKLGRYWGLCNSLAENSRKYANTFGSLQLQPLPPYEAKNSSIAFVPGQKARCLVHAEIQLLIFYSIRAAGDIRRPRVIGVSKSCCYLCNLYIIKYDQFFITKSHGRLYERWNFPDVRDFNPHERERHRRILQSINKELLARYKIESKAKNRRKREHPMGSWLTLPPPRLLSPVPSTILSSLPPDANSGHNGSQSPDVLAGPNATPERTLGPQFVSSSDKSLVGSESTAHATLEDSPSNMTQGGDNVDCAFSTSSTASWEFPIRKDISSSSTFRAKVDNVSLSFEIEGSSHGSLEIERRSTSDKWTSGGNVDLRTLRLGEEMTFSKDPGEDLLILNLRHSHERSIQLSLKWK